MKVESINKQHGASLVEAMISLFVFAVGALGIAAIQTTSLVRVDDTKQRSLAIWKAQELADRIRSSKSVDDPDGLLAEYIAAVGNTNADDGIGKIDTSDQYQCPNAAPTRCDDINGTNAAACSPAQMVAFDLWSVMCDADSGLAVDGTPNDGAIGLRDVEIALEQNGADFRLYLEWSNREAGNDLDLQTTAQTVTTNLCGDDETIDARLDAYCLRFQ